MKVILIPNGVQGLVSDDESVIYTRCTFNVDSDGTGPAHGDPDEQPATSYKPNLNADVDPYWVFPAEIFLGVKGRVMGCRVEAHNRLNGRVAVGVVGDDGPRTKLGEGAVYLAELLGINPSPVNGGDQNFDIDVFAFPEVPAVVTLADGTVKTYELQPFRNG